MITFIIPTIGRPTIGRSLSSLIGQRNDIWKANVIYDGIPVALDIVSDDRISCCSIPKCGVGNAGGEVRNFGLDRVGTEWAAFLDDDDALTTDWTDEFLREMGNHPDADIVVLRAIYNDGVISPPLGWHHIQKHYVGITFAVRMDFINRNNIRFKNSYCEDFDFLEKCQQHGAIIVVSDAIGYQVRFSCE